MRWGPTERLDAVARSVAREWGLALGERHPLARYSFVAPAGDAMLKVDAPEDDESVEDIDALRLWGGEGAVRLLRADRARRAMLLERAVPGGDASGLGDVEAIDVAVRVGRRLWRPAGPPFARASARVPAWLAAVRGTGHRFLAAAAAALARLAVRDDVLVHGDFHHHNLLRHGGDWVAIDPKPLLATPEFDVVTLLWNPLGAVPTPERTERQVARLASHGLDARAIRDWAIVRGTYLGLPLGQGEDEDAVRQLRVVRALVDGR